MKYNYEITRSYLTVAVCKVVSRRRLRRAEEKAAPTKVAFLGPTGGVSSGEDVSLWAPFSTMYNIVQVLLYMQLCDAMWR